MQSKVFFINAPLFFFLERRRGGEKKTEAREKQSGCCSVSEQKEREDRLPAKSRTHRAHLYIFSHLFNMTI